MDVGDYNRRSYRERWLALNRMLNEIRARSGLGAAFETLVAQQLDVGFVEDDLQSVRRYRICHPDDRSRGFQFSTTPGRAFRHSGAGRSLPPPGTHSENDGCFLDEENIAWQQRGIEIGYELTLGTTEYCCYCNPFPLMPVHMTVATRAHVPQSWSWADAATSGIPSLEQLFSDLLTLARELPGYVVFFNGPGAGASIPSHFHFQLFKRPPGHEPFALEEAPLRKPHASTTSVTIKEYPVTVAFFEGEQQDRIAEEASRWMLALTSTFESPESLSANIIATSSSGLLHLHVVPRHRSYSYSPGFAGLVGGLEILGELVLSTEEDKQNLDLGNVRFDTVAGILAAVD